MCPEYRVTYLSGRTVDRIDANGRLEIRWDSGRTSSFGAGEWRHLDYSYAVTSHSSQGQTAGRVLVHVETERASEKLVNQRLAYVAVSREQYDARIYTDDKVKLALALNRDVSHISALERDRVTSSGHAAERHVGPRESPSEPLAMAPQDSLEWWLFRADLDSRFPSASLL
jgi:hypothetical protein